MKKRIVAGIVSVCIIVGSFSAGVLATSSLEEIKAYLNYGINIKLDGQTQTMHNANGERVYPISYQGTTYVPIRAVSNMLDIPVEWDGQNNAVLLGETGTAKDFIEMKPYAGQWAKQVLPQDNKPETIAGKQYSEYICGYVGSEAYYDLGGKYSVLTFDAYTQYSDAAINFYGDNEELITTIYIEQNQLPKTHKINIKNVTQLKIETKAIIYLFNATLE